MKKAFLLPILLLLALNASIAQKVDLGSWNILNLKYHLTDKWGIYAEGQVRSLKFYNNFHYYEAKAWVSYKAFQNFRVALGAGTYQTYREGGNFVLPKNNNEFRIWPQIVFIQPVGAFRIEHRYRAEFRFTSNGYRNRFRFRLGVSYPFGKERDDYKPFQATVSNELFFTNNEPYFERNRLLFNFNYKPSKALTLQVGYLHQFDYKINDETGRDFFVIGCYIEMFRKVSAEKTNDTDLKDN